MVITNTIDVYRDQGVIVSEDQLGILSAWQPTVEDWRRTATSGTAGGVIGSQPQR